MPEHRDTRHGTRNARFQVSNPESSRYQVFFRTSRGGCGIKYETAKAEFLSVFRDAHMELLRETPARMRMAISIHELSAGEISARAENLGYTQGIVSVRDEPYLGEELHSTRTVRWAVGWLRRGDRKIHLTEIYRQNEEKLLAEAPDRRVFLIEKYGQIVPAKGHRYRRGLSPADARFMVNIAELRGHEVILDPFAGIGGILIECRRRGLTIFAGDSDSALRPGLALLSHNLFVTADARQLPFKDKTFHAVITEPPFDTRHRQAVLNSVAELRRVVRKDGQIILLVARDMHRGIMARMAGSGFQLTGDFMLRRHGKLISHVLAFRDQESR